MKILKNQSTDNILTATILIEAVEFASSLQEAYQVNKHEFTLPGREEGMISRKELEQVFGATVLYDEALDICIPKLYLEFIHEHQIAPVNQPEIVGVSWLVGGSVTFTIKIPTRPKVSPNQYKGIVVQVPADEKEAFTEAVMCEAARRTEVVIPEALVDQKLDATLAKQKMQIGRDPIYNVLADMVEILRKAYHATGITRSMAQVRSEAMDIMLQTMSGDQKEPSREHLFFLLKETVKGYRELPNRFDEKLDQILKERKQRTISMTPEERVTEAFSAYLGSLELTEEGWLRVNRDKAVLYAKFDLLLDAVGEAESIAVTPEEMEEAFVGIGRQCDIDTEQVKASIDTELLEWQLKRDKARKLILDSAVTKG